MAKLSTNDYKITLNGTNFSDHLAGVTVPEVSVEQFDSSAFGMGWTEHTLGVKSGQVTLNFQQDFGASSVDATLWPLIGARATIVATPTAGTVSPTNPSYTAVCSVVQYTPIAGNFNQLATFDVTWPVNGTVTRGTA